MCGVLIKSFVLMCRRTGNMVEGWRIALIDYRSKDWSLDIGLTVIDNDNPDGWILYHPQNSEFKLFFNRKWVDKEFENLGEL